LDFDFTKEPGRKLQKPLKEDSIIDPMLSIITPFYNAGAFLEQTFCSVMNQTFPWFEWIIVDDGSKDLVSLEILERLAGKDRRIRVFHQDNGGISTARNTGIRESRTEIIVPLDADDLIEPVFLEELFFTLEMKPEAAWAYTDSVGFGKREYLWRKNFSSIRMKTENILVYTAAIRKKWLLKVNGYEESDRSFNEDWHLWLRLLAAGAVPVHVRGYLFWYRRKDSGVLYTIQQDQELKEEARKKIEEAAADVKKNIPVREYPVKYLSESYRLPRSYHGTRKVFSPHGKIRVLLLLPFMVMGGADRFNLEVCSRMDRDRFEIGIITTIASDNEWQQRFAEHVTDIFNLPDFLDLENWAEFISYYIKSREVDVLFLSNSHYGYYLLPWIRKEFPDLVIMDYVHMEEWNWGAGGFARTSGVMNNILEKTFVCNEKTREVMIRHFKCVPETVETLHIGTDPEMYDPDKVDTGYARKKINIDESRPVILFPCRLAPQKRPFLMLEIAKSLRDKIPDAAFIVVGDGPMLKELKETSVKDGLTDTVYFAGRQDDMLPWYKDASLTLICSVKEGIALAAYESLAMGVPVITSDVGGQSELIDERVGRVLPMMQDEAKNYHDRTYSPEEVGSYVSAIVSTLSNPEEYQKMCTAARQRMMEGFSMQRMISKLEETFEEMVSDEVLREKRKTVSEALKMTESCVTESVSVYLRWRSEAEKGNQYFQELKKIREKHSACTRELQSIRNMRSWKLVQQYRHFMDRTGPGRFLRTIRDLFRR